MQLQSPHCVKQTDSRLCSSVMKTVWTELSPPAGPCRPLLVFLCPVGLFFFSWTDVIFAKGHSSRKHSEEAQSITSCFLSHTQQNLKTKLGSHAEKNLFQTRKYIFFTSFHTRKRSFWISFFIFFYLIGWKRSSWKNDIILNFFIYNFFCFGCTEQIQTQEKNYS